MNALPIRLVQAGALVAMYPGETPPIWLVAKGRKLVLVGVSFEGNQETAHYEEEV